MLEQQHHRNVAQNAKRERKAEALDRCAGRKNSVSAETSVTRSASMEVRMPWRTPVMDAARTLRPHANFFTETLKRKN